MIEFYGELINPLQIVSLKKYTWPGKEKEKYMLTLVTSDGDRRSISYTNEQKREDDYNNIKSAMETLIKSIMPKEIVYAPKILHSNKTDTI